MDELVCQWLKIEKYSEEHTIIVQVDATRTDEVEEDNKEEDHSGDLDPPSLW